MKCCSLLFILFFSFSIFANTVKPLGDNRTIVNGEIYNVVLESELSDEEVEAYQNSKINEIMYLLEYDKNLKPRQLKVFVTDPPQKKQEDENKEEIIFSYQGFQYKPEQKIKNPKLFSFQENKTFTDEEIRIASIGLATLVALIIFVILLKVFKKWSQSRAKKRDEKNEIEKLKESILLAKTRQEFEKIHRLRKKIYRFNSEPPKDFEMLLLKIYSIQYKSEWSEEELSELVQLKNKVDVEDIFNGV